MKILDKELRKSISYKIGKYNINEFELSDLERIKDLSLSNRGIPDKDLNINLNEISNLPNLQILSLQNFDINDDVIEILNSCKSLITLQLEICTINGQEILKNTTLKNIMINYCNIKNLRNIIFPENVILTANEVIDMNEFWNIGNIKNLYLRNSDVINFKKILEFENLESLNLDGSKVDSLEVLEEIKKKIFVSQEREYRPIV